MILQIMPLRGLLARRSLRGGQGGGGGMFGGLRRRLAQRGQQGGGGGNILSRAVQSSRARQSGRTGFGGLGRIGQRAAQQSRPAPQIGRGLAGMRGGASRLFGALGRARGQMGQQQTPTTPSRPSVPTLPGRVMPKRQLRPPGEPPNVGGPKLQPPAGRRRVL